jgi:hypothetical protein
MTKLFRYFVLIILFSGGSYAGGTASNVTVYKSPTCGCCAGWVDYLRDNGFKVVTHNVDSLDKSGSRINGQSVEIMPHGRC